MESSKLWARVVACAMLLSMLAGAETSDSGMELDLDTRAIRDFYPKDPNLTNEKQLVSVCAMLSGGNTKAMRISCVRASL